MYRFLFVFVVFASLVPSLGLAYGVTEHKTPVPYQVVTLSGTPEEQQFIVGELNGYPQMIEIKSDRDFELYAQLRLLPGGTTTPDLSGIVVQVLEPRGVAEVARLKPSDAAWALRRDPVSALSYLEGPQFQASVASGTYRVEVSTPENVGKYILAIGKNPTNSSYGETWSAVGRLYDFCNVTKIGMFRSPLLYYPLGVIVAVVGFAYTLYRTRNRLTIFRNHA